MLILMRVRVIFKVKVILIVMAMVMIMFKYLRSTCDGMSAEASGDEGSLRDIPSLFFTWAFSQMSAKNLKHPCLIFPWRGRVKFFIYILVSNSNARKLTRFYRVITWKITDAFNFDELFKSKYCNGCIRSAGGGVVSVTKFNCD